MLKISCLPFEPASKGGSKNLSEQSCLRDPFESRKESPEKSLKAAAPLTTTSSRSHRQDMKARLAAMDQLLASGIDYKQPSLVADIENPVFDEKTWHGKPFFPPKQDKLSSRMQHKLAAAARFCRDNPRAPLPKMLSIVPKISSFRFAEAIQIARSFAPSLQATGDFSAVELFKVSEGSATIRTKDARDLFELLFVGLGAFPIGCDNLEWNLEPIVNKNPSKLIIEAGFLPGDDKPAYATTGSKKLLELAGEEVTARRYLGPFTLDEARMLFKEGIVISSAFLISKPHNLTTKFRLVHNASSAKGNINASINASDESGYKVRLDHTSKYLEFVRTQLQEAAGAPIFQVVCDVSKCYRRFAIRSTDTPRYGLRVDITKNATVPFFAGGDTEVTTKAVKKGQMAVYFDTCLPFGSTASVSSCVRVTNYMRDVQRELMLTGTCCSYIDDCVLVGTKATVDTAVASLRGLMERIGLPENVLKRQLVSQVSEFLGITYDYTGAYTTMSITKKKLKSYLRHINYFLDRDSDLIKRSELESLVGKLVHCSTIIKHAKIFYQRLLAALRNSESRHKNSILTLGIPEMDDLRWWRTILKNHCGSSILTEKNGYDHKIYTDAST